MGGYVFNLSEKLKFKPSFLGRVVSGLPATIDLNANFLIADRVWLGGMYRTGDAFGFMAQLVISNGLRLGYSIDFSTTELKNYQNGTHEVMVSYELNNLKKDLGLRLY
jgi:type IX secretion system PorP/SprF family membrane protein